MLQEEIPDGPNHFSSRLSHLAAVAHKTLHVKDSPPEVAGVCSVFSVISGILSVN